MQRLRITANQVTLLRLLLLPVPVAMLYQGSQAWLVAALAVYVVLGLTDALDGYLARRYGSTALGAFLDPIVDKIFLAAGYVPLADLGVVATPIVVVLFVRELAVTKLRSLAAEESLTFRTSRIAKLKTTVQMAGAGFILLIWLFPSDRVILPLLSVAAAGSAVPMASALVRWSPPGWRGVSGFLLISGVALSRYLLPPGASIQVIGTVIVAFTVVSGFEYAWSLRAMLARRLGSSFLEAARLVALSLVLPGLFLPALELPGAPTVTLLLLVAFELAAGGLDNFLAQAGVHRPAGAELVRPILQAAAGVLLVADLVGEGGIVPALLPALAALVVTVADLVLRLAPNLEALRSRP